MEDAFISRDSNGHVRSTRRQLNNASTSRAALLINLTRDMIQSPPLYGCIRSVMFSWNSIFHSRPPTEHTLDTVGISFVLVIAILKRCTERAVSMMEGWRRCYGGGSCRSAGLMHDQNMSIAFGKNYNADILKRSDNTIGSINTSEFTKKNTI